ncbi:MAG TPA: sulfatase-like hydrolase/transferase, partial [Armatimonadota bacterium]|nr:sulfatase-like hydrolase/transferase [Armatimonadota bacterium]
APIREHLRTPNIDRIMADGTRFSNAFSCSPLCGPSRAGYLTGRYPYLTANEERAHDGWEVGLRDSDAIFPEYLRATGYTTKHVGKCHVGAAKFMDAFGESDSPWNRWAPPLADDDGYHRYLRDLGVTPPTWPNPIKGLRPDRQTPGNNCGGWIAQSDGREFPEEGTYSQYLSRLATETLDSALGQSAGDPVYLQLDYFAPHQPFLVPGCYAERARELAEHIQLPASYHAALKGQDWPRVYDVYLRNWGMYDEATARQYMLMNFVQIEALDAAIGRFLNALDERGIYDESLIVLTGDHGEMNCERALVDKGVYGHPKVAMVPLSVKLPRERGAGRTVDEMVSLLDIAPTVFEAAGIAPAERLDGESLLPHIRGEAIPERDPILFECGWHVAPNPAVSTFAEVDGTKYMYTYNLTSDRDELYDLADATYRDLSSDPGRGDAKRAIIRRLGAVLEADARWACYWHTFRLDKYADLDVGSGDFQMFKPE